MRTLTIKGIPDDLYARLKRRAAEHRRSINSELLVCLERMLRSRRIDPSAMLSRADAVRERLTMPPWTPEALKEAKSAGRP
ncbi:MAG: FitA-like ribbon-helix-helix domain-containing protein [Gemmatimonadales bacterium]